MVIKNLENKIKLVGIICCFFLLGCIVISLGSIWTARSMVVDAQQKIYVLDGTVPILVERTTMEKVSSITAKSRRTWMSKDFRPVSSKATNWCLS